MPKKALRLILPQAALLALPFTALSQTNFPVTPTTPQSFKFRPVGQSMDTGATVAPSAVPAVKRTTCLTLGQVRQWKSSDGNSRVGQLIAWEQSVTTVKVPANTNRSLLAISASPAAARSLEMARN
ncbi:MAG: hypothetical protein EOP88_24985 [Verrucomicrobiaceae bacterium]|nr:MAG: hypothetical protein EOP88_24985 [Verrucomicrobiaceae bacterium]